MSVSFGTCSAESPAGGEANVEERPRTTLPRLRRRELWASRAVAVDDGAQERLGQGDVLDVQRVVPAAVRPKALQDVALDVFHFNWHRVGLSNRRWQILARADHVENCSARVGAVHRKVIPFQEGGQHDDPVVANDEVEKLLRVILHRQWRHVLDIVQDQGEDVADGDDEVEHHRLPAARRTR